MAEAVAKKAPVRPGAPPWVLAVRAAGVVVLCAFIPIILGLPIGRRLFWTVAIAVLPLGFTLAGYHVWRRVCPLAFFATLGRTLGVQGKRKAGDWLAKNYFYVQFGALATALAIRLTATNGTPWALAGFLVLIVAAATLVGFLYTGKTWCNYLCPVGLVEKIYNEPVGGRGASPANSQCQTCTACKKNCPDIDLELHHWKELDLPARHNVYLMWPGVVLGFYTYYWLVAGDWGYYFSGDWTRETGQIAKIFGPGFFFAPFVPRILAAPLTLATFAATSWLVMKSIERFLLPRLEATPQIVRHRARVLSGFTAFLLFYCFAGQPTLRALPQAVQTGFAILVVFVATMVVIRRWHRREETYVQEKFARGLLRRWEWGDAPPQQNLSDIYVLHTERTKQKEARLKAYKDTLSEMLADGVVSRNEVALLDKLRHQLGVSDKDHAKILGELSADAKKLLDPEHQGSIEKRLQLDQYRGDLERMLMLYADRGEMPGEAALDELRQRHRISHEDHAAALAGLRDASSPVFKQLRDAVATVTRLRRAARRAQAAGHKPGSVSLDFFAWLAGWREERELDRAMSLLAALDGETALRDARAHFAAGRPAQAAELLAGHSGDLGPALAEILRRAPDDRAWPPPDDAEDGAALIHLAEDGSPHVRAGAAFLLSRFDGDAERNAVAALAADPVALVRETAIRALGARGRLTRDIVSGALADADRRVVEAVMRAVVPRAGAADDTAELAKLVATRAATLPASDDAYATLDPKAALDSLSTFEKMMLLRNVPLFAGLDPGDLEELSAITLERRFGAGDHLCREGEISDDVFVLVSGKAQAWVRAGEGKRVLGESGAGSCIGEMAALDRAPRTAWVTALEETRALVMPGGEFQDLLDDRPAIARGVISVLTQRLRGMIAGAQKEMTR